MDGYYCYTIVTKSNPEIVYSGSTNNLARRMREHNGAPNKARYTKRFGHNNAKLAIKIGPLPKMAAKSIENRMKRYIYVGGGITGRCRALAKLLSLPAYVTRTVRLTGDELRHIKVETSLTRNEFEAITGMDQAWIDKRQFTFGAEEM